MRKNTIFRALGILAILALTILVLSLKQNGEMQKNFVVITGEEAEISSGADVSAESRNASASTERALLYVYLTGAVHEPGVYVLPEGSRLFEAVVRAGGLTEDADLSGINEASFLSDGQHIHVPKYGEPIQDASAGSSEEIVNINTAGPETLVLLPGIGEAKAAAIVRYRNANGPFSCIEDIMNVSGIGKALFEQIKDRIRIS